MQCHHNFTSIATKQPKALSLVRYLDSRVLYSILLPLAPQKLLSPHLSRSTGFTHFLAAVGSCHRPSQEENNKTRACAASKAEQGDVLGIWLEVWRQMCSRGPGLAVGLWLSWCCLFSYCLIENYVGCRHIIIYLFVLVEALFRKCCVSVRDVIWVLEKCGCLSK